MRLLIYSDLHLESSPFVPPQIYPAHDVLILAGDIDQHAKGIAWALNSFPNIPILYVLGNHEYDHNFFPEQLLHMRQLAQNTEVQILDLNSYILGNVEFFGCTLWTDFGLHGDKASSRQIAQQRMNDYKVIKHHSGLLTPEIISAYHEQSLQWLAQALAQSSAKYKIVITHHAPSKLSVSQEFVKSEVAAAYVNQLDDFIKNHYIDLWIHGHTHQKIDYHIGQTRVFSNPRRYRGSKPQLRFNSEEIIVLNNY